MVSRFAVIPKSLPIVIQPSPGELLSSWLQRVAAANAVTPDELLASILVRQPQLKQIPFVDYGLAPATREHLSTFCGIPQDKLWNHDLQQLFPCHSPQWFTPGSALSFDHRLPLGFCVQCLTAQWRDGRPIHFPAEWALPFLTHCPIHRQPLCDFCRPCYTAISVELVGGGSTGKPSMPQVLVALHL
jgi:hypothetical protein